MRERRLLGVQFWLWRWLDLARRRPRLTLAAWGAASLAAAALAASMLGVDADTAGMISSAEPFRRDEAALEAAFPDLDERVVAIVRASSVDDARAFAGGFVSALAGEAAVEAAFAPEVDAFFQRNGLLYLEVGELERLLDRLNRAAPLIERLGAEPSLAALFDALAQAGERAAAAAADAEAADIEARARVELALAQTIEARLAGEGRALSWRSLFDDGAEGDARSGQSQIVVSIRPRLDYGRLAYAREVRDAVVAAAQIARAETGVDAEVLLTGDPIMRSEELASVSRGIGLAFALSFLAVAVLLVIGLRSAALSLAALASVLVSVALTAGFAALAVGALNLVSVAFAVLLVGLGVDFAIHLALAARAGLMAGKTRRAALYGAVREIGAAFVIAAATTSLAFFSFAPTRFTGMAQLGLVAGVGVVIAVFASTSLVAATVALMARPAPRAVCETPAPIGRGWTRARRVAAWGVVALGLGAVWVLPLARFDADPMALRDPDAASVRAFNVLAETPDAAPYRLSVLARDLADADARAEALERLDEVRRATTLSAFFPTDEALKRELIDFAGFGLLGALDAGVPSPAGSTQEAIDRLMVSLAAREDAAGERLGAALGALAAAGAGDAALEEALRADVFRHWPALRSELRAQLRPGEISLETLPGELVARYLAPDGRARVEIAPRDDLRDPGARRAFVDAVTAAAPHAAGAARSTIAAGDVVARAMALALALAAAGVVVVVSVAMRDALAAAYVLAPLVLAGVLTAATATALGLAFNFANVIVLPLLAGLGVDGGVHLALRARLGPQVARIYRTTTPRAVLFSALTTIASFASLMSSSHRGVFSMGALLAIALFWTSVCAIIVLPTVMEVVEARRLRFMAARGAR